MSVESIEKEEAALTLAAAIERKMTSGICQFVFRKEDGSERTAFGSISSTLVGGSFMNKSAFEKETFLRGLYEQIHSVGSITLVKDSKDYKALEACLGIGVAQKAAKEKSLDLRSYYDLESGGWRSYKVSNLIKIIG